jgi:phage terminase large subunit-like protein
MASVPKGIRGTLNPDKYHFVYDWVKPYIDEEGFPIKELSGKLRYYYRINNELITSWDRDELMNKYGVPAKNGVIDPPETYTYIPSTLEDNEELTKRDPKYRAKLNALPERKRKQLLQGCWAENEDSGKYFKRDWVTEIKTADVPKDCVWVRSYDLGYAAPSADLKPDYTASILMGKDRLNNIYIKGDYHPDFKDPDTERLGQLRMSPGERDIRMMKQAEYDTNKVYIVLPKENASGAEVFQHKVKLFAQKGFIVKQDPMSSNANKLFKFEPFSSYAENGCVYICPDSFHNKVTYEGYLEHLERFNPEQKSNGYYKDDLADATAGAFNTLMTLRHVPLVVRNQIATTQISSELLSR